MNIFKRLKALFRAAGFGYQFYKTKRRSFFSTTQIKAFQELKLKALLNHAYNKVVYYRRLFDRNNIKPQDIKTIEDLSRIPVTLRETFQAVPIDERTPKGLDVARCGNLRTSGSTGMPLDIFVDVRDASRRLFFLRMCLESGRHINDKMLFIVTPHSFLPQQWFHPCMHSLKILRERYLSLDNKTGYLLNELKSYKPDIVLSYPSIIKELALQIAKKGITGIRPRMVFTTGEMLSNSDRALISSVFKAEVFDYYACNECGIIAWECKEHSGYHIDSDNVIVELVRDGKRVPIGEEGEVVITALNSHTMPFIRYKLGDTAVLSDKRCSCGVDLALCKVIIGRIYDHIILPGGKRLSPYHLTCAIENIAGVRKYQVVQASMDMIEVKVVKDEKFSNKTVSDTEMSLKRLTGGKMGIKITVVEDIVSSKGKFSTVASRIA